MSTFNAQIHVKDSNGTLYDIQPKTTIANVSGLQTALDGKVNTVSGKGLSSNDYTTTEKNKLAGIATGAQVNSITGVKGNSETNYRTGDVNLTAANIGAAASSHTHGNIQSGGTLQTNDITIANGDKLVVTDSSDSSKIARTSVSFDGSTTTKCLTQKGTFETFNNYSHPSDGANTGSFGDSSNQTPTYGGTFKVPYLIVNSKGHVTAISEHTVKIPASDNTDTHRPIQVNGTQVLGNNTTALNLKAGSNVSLSDSSGTVTIAATDTTYSAATQSADGLMSATDKTKLNGIATGANNYSHPTTSGNKHIPSGGSSGQILRWSADGTATWGSDNNTWTAMVGATSSANGSVGYVNAVPPKDGYNTKYLRADGTWQVPPDNNTTYSAATQSTSGLMSASDKTKLDGIATGANKIGYELKQVNLGSLSWNQSSSGIYYSSKISIPNITTILGATIYDWGYLRSSDVVTPTISDSNLNGISIIANTNSFENNAALYLLVFGIS